MDRTLFTSPMIETFRVCRRAYQLAFLAPEGGRERLKLSTVCKRFLLKAIAEINRGRLTSLPQVQKYLGQHWPSNKLTAGDDIERQEKSIQAFRFVYRALTHYISNPYRPDGSEPAGVNIKVRARVQHSKLYIEDTFDLILWHPETRVLEIVDYHLHPLKQHDPAWPAASLLVKYYLAQRLKARWGFEKLVMTFCQMQSEGLVPVSIELDDSVFRLHWPELVKTVNQMKDPEDFAPHRSALCRRCEFLTECLSMGSNEETPCAKGHVSLSA